MSCPSPFDALRLATEHLTEDLYRLASYQSVFTNLIPREEFPEGIGLVQSVFTIGRSEPTTDEPAFTQITTTTNGSYTGTCGQVYTDMQVGFNETTFYPEQFGFRGPTVCQDDLIYNFKAAAFWQNYIPALSKYVDRTISNRYAAIYTHYSRKGVANANFYTVDGQTGTPPTSPVLTLDQSHCELDQTMLDTVAAELNENGATNPNSNGWITQGEDGPEYPLYIGQRASQALTLDNADIRNDTRYANMGDPSNTNPLFKRIGATKVIRNFRHVINLFPPRFSWNTATNSYTRVPTWIMPAGTKGDVAAINPNWKSTTTAPYEGCWVLTPWVFHDQIIRPVNMAAGMSWSPKSYMGELMFKVGGAKIFDPPCYDPEEKLGAHYGSYKHAAKPIFPQFGYFLIFKRCYASTYPCTTCSTPVS